MMKCAQFFEMIAIFEPGGKPCARRYAATRLASSRTRWKL